VEASEQVRVYFNLHKKKFSVQSKKGNAWKVGSYANLVHLKSPRFVVSQAGRNRAVREQQRNVHAYVQGAMDVVWPYGTDEIGVERLLGAYAPSAVRVAYNPFRSEHFTSAAGDVMAGDRAVLVAVDDRPELWVVNPR
jgi:hypothetical protein